MIRKVELGSVQNNITPINQTRQGNPNFTGLGKLALKGIQKCEESPMINVAVLDMVTAILPRTFLETFIGSKQTDENGEAQKRKLNIFGGFEAFRRESSGLLINCIIPSFIVIGVAKLLNTPVMGKMFKKAHLPSSWANSEAIGKIQHYYTNSTGKNKEERVYNTLKTMLNDIEGVDGDIDNNGLKKFKDIIGKDKEVDKAIREAAQNITSNKPASDYAEKLYRTIIKKTGISENIRFAGDNKFSTSNLSHICNSATEILEGANRVNILEDSKALEKYFKKATTLVNAKSILGLGGVIIPLAIAAQPINRWITHKLAGKKGAPIYNDDKERHLTPEEQTKLKIQKFFAVPLMWSVAGLSMLMDRPSLKMFQFKNIFPTMDQARIISAATFSSRIAASEDSNELKENTIRDIATFSSFYFLGDYAAKAIATGIEKHTGVRLTNKLKNSKPDANIFEKFWNWAKHTKMKSTDEFEVIANEALKTKSKNLRAWCQLGNLTFSIISLGIFIPLYTRTQTNKKKQLELEKEANLKSNAASFTSNMLIEKSPAFKSFQLGQQQKAS